MPDDSTGKPTCDHHADDNCGCIRSPLGVETTTTVVMAKAYGTVLVVLSVGFVAFFLMLSYMAFEQPEKAKTFLDNFMAPALALGFAYGAKAIHGYVTQKGK